MYTDGTTNLKAKNTLVYYSLDWKYEKEVPIDIPGKTPEDVRIFEFNDKLWFVVTCYDTGKPQIYLGSINEGQSKKKEQKVRGQNVKGQKIQPKVEEITEKENGKEEKLMKESVKENVKESAKEHIKENVKDQKLEISPIVRLESPVGAEIEKNWLPMVHKDKLVLIYSHSPYTLLYPAFDNEIPTGKCEVVKPTVNFDSPQMEDLVHQLR